MLYSVAQHLCNCPVRTDKRDVPKVEMYEILTKRGVIFDRLIKRPLQTSVDRLAAVKSTSMFPAAFESDFAGPHVKTYLRCSAYRLLVDNGAVIGVRVQPRDDGPPFNIRARYSCYWRISSKSLPQTTFSAR